MLVMHLLQFLGTVAVLLLLPSYEARRTSNPYGPKVIPLTRSSRTFNLKDYERQREAFIERETFRSLGEDIILKPEEVKANKILMEAKLREYEEGLHTPHKFAPSKHLFEVLDKIKESPLFKIISDMPKGGVLHAHDTALCSTDFVIKLTYRDNLWGCHASDGITIKSFRFSKSKPNEAKDCTWNTMADIRESKGADNVDKNLRERLTLYPKTKYEDNNEVWRDFIGIFGLLDGLLFYAPVWGDYYYNALTEFYADGVQYLEFRSTLPTLYDMDGKEYSAVENVRIYVNTLKKFMDANPDFIGSKVIYAPLRFADDKKFDEYEQTCYQIKKEFPDFVAGFDLVGQEETGRPLKDFVPKLLNMKNNNIDFYFHAGETNWFGSTVDENLIDAVLLGTKRIGHGFAVIKHPYVLEKLKEYDIAVELNPLSNQVLQLVADLRNHPGSFLFADNYPVVVSSDDPSFWKATPLSHDFYVAFLGIASAHADLKLLKQLGYNSLLYSSSNIIEKFAYRDKWLKKWDEFIKKLAKGGGAAYNLNPRTLLSLNVD